MKLNPEQQERLLEELGDVFTALADVRELVQLADPPSLVSLDQVALGQDLVEILRRVMLKADDGNWLGNLLDAAIELRHASPALRLVRAELDDVITAERADHFAACWLLGDRVLVDRDPLRAAVEHLEAVPGSQGTTKQIMVVTGPRMSGRSWSRQYIRYLMTTRRSFDMVFVDLESLANSIVGDNGDDIGLRPEHLGESIAKQMKLDMTDWPARKKEKDERWAYRFCDWLKGQLTGQQTIWWIVLDSFDKILLPDGIYVLIGELALRIQVNLQMLRLVLLSYNRQDDLPSDVLPDVELISTSTIGEPELVAFFVRLYDQRKRRFNIDFGPQDVANSVAEVKRKVDFGSASYLHMLGPAVVQEARKLRSAGGGT